MNQFETGPIRPPSEASSILIRFTKNCPWNRCAFCSSYKDQKFSFRSIEEIKKDIDLISETTALLAEIIYKSNNSSDLDIAEAVRKVSLEKNIPVHQADICAFWLLNGMKSVFIQDADSLVMKPRDIEELLLYIKKKFPSVESITTYARSKTVSKKTLSDLISFRQAGLTRLNIGLESGSKKVLELIKKGVTPDEHITAGRNAKEAGLLLSEYYMPGAGGIDLLMENAVESAKILNLINPDYIRIRSVVPLPGSGLHDLMLSGAWTNPSEDQKIEEIKIFISKLQDIDSEIESGHIMNLLEDLDGRLPEEKQRLISIVDSYLDSDKDIRESFIIARRLGMQRFFSGFKTNQQIEDAKIELIERFGSIQKSVEVILQNYI